MLVIGPYYYYYLKSAGRRKVKNKMYIFFQFIKRCMISVLGDVKLLFLFTHIYRCGAVLDATDASPPGSHVTSTGRFKETEVKEQL